MKTPEQDVREYEEKLWAYDFHYSANSPEQSIMEEILVMRPVLNKWVPYGTVYFCIHNILFVSGDSGHAVYIWSEPVTLDWIAGCAIGYFAEKCVASPHGAGYRIWDPDKARHSVLCTLKEDPEFGDRLGPAARVELKRDALRSANISRDSWEEFLMYRGDYFFDPIDWCDIGYRPAIECCIQLAGLKVWRKKHGTDV